MPRRLPPLNALRAFEAAARHGSFTRAASELHVTQAAISHQVKQLEDWLGLELFTRSGPALALTRDGKAYLPELSAALDMLALATERLACTKQARPLRITVLPSFAAKWLMPRLPRFRAAHPEIDVQLSTSAELHDFASNEYDLGIRSGLGRWRGLQADLIAREWMSPVCSPALLASGPPLKSPADLRQYTLLHDQPADLWQRWMDGADTAGHLVSGGPAFTDSALVLQGAVDGQGVALGRLFLAADDISAGRLVVPFAHKFPNDYSYWLVYPKHAVLTPHVTAFREWLLQEAALAVRDERK